MHCARCEDNAAFQKSQEATWRSGPSLPNSIPFPYCKSMQAVACLWINSPVFLNASAIARACRCHPVRHLSGPELPAADGGPPRAGRRVAVPAAGRIPDCQRQGRPAALLSDRAAHLTVTEAGFLQDRSLQNLMRSRLKEIRDPWGLDQERPQDWCAAPLCCTLGTPGPEAPGVLARATRRSWRQAGGHTTASRVPGQATWPWALLKPVS